VTLFQVHAALDGPQRFDAILMDILMQRTDGSTVCSELRQRGNRLPIVAMTGVIRCMCQGPTVTWCYSSGVCFAVLQGRQPRETRLRLQASALTLCFPNPLIFKLWEEYCWKPVISGSVLTPVSSDSCAQPRASAVSVLWRAPLSVPVFMTVLLFHVFERVAAVAWHLHRQVAAVPPHAAFRADVMLASRAL
jgi:CheY-like chemotaxis protein